MDGFELAYGEFGQGRPLVLVHGFCGSSAYWRLTAPELARHFRVITPDLRGHGASGLPQNGGCSMEELAGDLARLIEKLALDRPIVLGHSLGGYAALALAETRSGVLGGFGLVHSTALPDSPEAQANRDRGIARIRGEGLRPYVEELVPKLFAPEHRESMADTVREMIEAGWATNPEGAVRTLEGMKRRPDRSAVLREAAVPVLLVAGERDAVVPPERTFVADGPHIRAVRLAKAGHMGMLETPDELVAAIRSFAEGV
ncbi:alpha/beta hydrolase [Paenibacillus thermoaerophilus]|nr:alpha/beta hydrolase [Paenibacillus thermoaerophilus]